MGGTPNVNTTPDSSMLEWSLSSQGEELRLELESWADQKKETIIKYAVVSCEFPAEQLCRRVQGLDPVHCVVERAGRQPLRARAGSYSH